MRIIIGGAPKAGKFALANRLGVDNTRHTDDVIGLGWSDASAEVANWFNAKGDWVVEGVAVFRALRKWLKTNPHGKPCDELWILWDPRVPLNPGQETMAKGCVSVFKGIQVELLRRGVNVIEKA